MINISNEAKQKYVKDSVAKNFRIGFAHKDIKEISNINMGLPMNSVIYDMGSRGSSTPISKYYPYHRVFGNSYGDDIEILGTAKTITFYFKINLKQLHEEYLKPNARWIFGYKDADGATSYSYVPMPNPLDYKKSAGQYADVVLTFDINNGISDFADIYIECYDYTLLPTQYYYEGFEIQQVKVLYGTRNDVNLSNVVLLKNLPDFNIDDYFSGYITKETLEEESNDITESLSSKNNLKYGLCEASIFEFTVVNDDRLRVGDLLYPEMSLDGVANSYIPLGVYVVDKINKSYEGSLIKYSVLAYSKMTNLANKAGDWNSVYMFGINSETEDGSYTGNGFEFARQIYSSVYSALKFFGLDDIRNYTVTKIQDITPTASSVSRERWIKWLRSDDFYGTLYYYKMVVNNPNTSHRYMATYTNAPAPYTTEPMTDDFIIHNVLLEFTDVFDPLGRGFAKGDTLVVETDSNGDEHKYLVDKGDMFAISSDCVTLTIYVPALYKRYEQLADTALLLSKIQLYEIEDEYKLTNASERLMYYNYFTREIFPIQSSKTGRDVVRSILEVCGCLFRLDRRYGLPEFVYATKAGLYPSDTLYPSDYLFPRDGVGDSLEAGRYITLRAEDYTVQDIGRIQIVKDGTSNEPKSVVWEYTGSDDKNTYVIDDNIYYCNENMDYEFDLMADVQAVLSKMFTEISHNNYIPFKSTLVGLPWLECGDRINFRTYNDVFETFVYKRKLVGIDSLKDTFEAKGDELTEAVDTYAYTQQEE